MSFENRISKVRKAIEGSAELKAESESVSKPESKHYKETFSSFRLIKMINPEMYDRMIRIGSEGKELKDEMGPDLNKIVSDVIEELTNRNIQKADEATKQIYKLNLPERECEIEINKLNRKIILENDKELRNNPQLIFAFVGREQLLKKVIDFTTSSMLDLT